MNPDERIDDAVEDAAVDVVLVEDHPTFRLGLRTRLEYEPGISVVGEAGTAQEALVLIAGTAPEVAVVDLNLPDLSGVELIRRLSLDHPRTAVLVLTMLDDDSVFAAVRAGARGYLVKDAQPAAIVAAVRTVAAGDTVFSRTVAQRLLGLASQQSAQGRPAVFGDLTEREHQILELVAAGYSNAEVGRRLGLRPKTVRNYVSNVLTKLQAADRGDAIRRARDAGIGAP
jgi:DNA-binding NarL/FixJ family response regulator